MKTKFSFLITLIILFISVRSNAEEGTGTVNLPPNNLGLVARLSYTKTTAQNQLLNYMAYYNSEIEVCKKDPKCETPLHKQSRGVLAAYQKLETDYNSFVSQLMALMMLQQKPMAYRKIDKTFRTGKPYLKNQQQALYDRIRIINDDLNHLEALIPVPVHSTNGEKSFDASSLIPSLKDLYDIGAGIAASIKEQQKNKADALNGLLKELLLPSAKDLIGGKKEEKKAESR